MNASLTAFLFWFSVAVCAVAELAIVAATMRASRRASSSANEARADLPQVDGARPLPALRRWLEALYAVVPAVLLIVLFVFTWRAMQPPGPVHRSAAAIAPGPTPLAGPIPHR